VSVSIRPFGPADRGWAEELIAAHQGERLVARLGELTDPLELPGLVAERGGRPLGLLTWRIRGDQFEVATLHSRQPRGGAGSALLAAAATLATSRGCRRLWLVTTNDNLEALGFYQRRGLRLAALHAGAVDRDRALKATIPARNPDNGIPVRDLLELELPLEPVSPSPG
jgi:ribosomal protein S18 acetylase RimI-like enzyme